MNAEHVLHEGNPYAVLAIFVLIAFAALIMKRSSQRTTLVGRHLSIEEALIRAAKRDRASAPPDPTKK